MASRSKSKVKRALHLPTAIEPVEPRALHNLPSEDGHEGRS